MLRLYSLSTQPALPDEIQAAFSAAHYSEDGQFGPTMWYHPNLRNIVLYGSGRAFGWGSFALRGMSLLTGILSVPLLGILLYLLTQNKPASLLASFLLAVDQVHITFSRQAIQETWTTFFFLLGTVLAVLHFQREKPWLLMASGVVFGLGIASKFHALFPLLVCLGAGIALSGRERSFSKGAFTVSCLVLLPAAVYVLTYIPWFGRGYDGVEWVQMQKVLFGKMMTHQGNPMDQIIDTAAWQWFLRPMGYANFVFAGDRPHITVAYSNPFAWLPILPAAAYLARDIVRKRYSAGERRGIVFLLLLFVVSYLPLAVSLRPIWLLSSLAVLPFAFMLSAVAVMQWSKAAAWGRKALAGYVVVVLVSAAALYPMALGKGKQFGYLSGIVEHFRPAFERR